MRNKTAVRWIFALVVMLLINTLYLTGAVNAKEMTAQEKPSLSNGTDYSSYDIISIGEEAPKALNTIIKAQKLAAKKDSSKESTFSPIKRGAAGDSVVEIQKKLLALGYLTTSVDGDFGPGTEQAVKDFQKVHQLTSDGIVNKSTYDALKKAEAEAKPIKKGASGDSVVKIQKRLSELGYLTSSVDGSFGSGTEQAVINFQTTNDLNPDGAVNENTYYKMFSSEAKSYVAPKQDSDNAVTRSSQERLVWITKTGKRYHSKSNCGSTKNAWQVPLEKAESMGLTPCGKCWKG